SRPPAHSPLLHSFLHDALPIYRLSGSGSGKSRVKLAGRLPWPRRERLITPAIQPGANRRGGARSREDSRDSVSACRFGRRVAWRSEEHTSELQSRVDLVCRLLL